MQARAAPERRPVPSSGGLYMPSREGTAPFAFRIFSAKFFPTGVVPGEHRPSRSLVMKIFLDASGWGG
jgi:hypothetical protein